MNGKEIDMVKLIDMLKAVAPLVKLCVMEDVHSIFGSSAGSNFQFGRVTGIMETALIAAGIIPYKVQPKAWQKIAWEGTEVVKLPTGRKNKAGKPLFKNDTKATSLNAATRLFPNESFLATSRSKIPHDGWVDAALIAYYGIRQFLQKKKAPGQ